MTPVPATRSFDPELTGYQYPRAVQFYEFQAQAQTLRMAYMCAEPESSNQKSVLLLHGKDSSGAYWEPTIRELLREGFRVIAPDQIGFGKSSKPHCYQFTFQALAYNFAVFSIFSTSIGSTSWAIRWAECLQHGSL